MDYRLIWIQRKFIVNNQDDLKVMTLKGDWPESKYVQNKAHEIISTYAEVQKLQVL